MLEYVESLPCFAVVAADTGMMNILTMDSRLENCFN